MSNKRLKKLTPSQREILQLLAEGQVMSIDKYNLPSIGLRNITPQTRYFLTNNRFVTRINPKKSVQTKGNGYIITERGRKVLLQSPIPKRRGTSNIRMKEKKCPGCEVIKSINDFVTIFGFLNPRGKFCKTCFLNHQLEHAISLMEGRYFCLYCGKKVEKVHDWTAEGKPLHIYLHLDHMDPISRGGEDTKHNTVYCCVACNLKKKDKLFTDWLKELKPECRDLSRKVYVAKHGRKPEDFKPSSNEIVFSIDFNEVLKELEMLE